MNISIVIPTLNNENIIGRFFDLLNNQDFPKDNIEILVLDGGSEDKTIKIAKENNAKVISNPQVLAEPGVNLGIRKASGNLIMILAVDNFLNDSNFISKMLKVFEDNSIYAAFPKHESDNTDSIFTKYVNIFTDPFNHFVYGYAANARSFKKAYKTNISNSSYDVYDYQSSKNKPMIAFAQGFTFKASFRRIDDDLFDDCRPVIRLIESGKKIAYVHSTSVVHHTIKDCDHFLRKQRWATLNAIKKENYGIYHRFSMLSTAQKIKVKIWPLYAASFILPLFRSIWGFFRDREPMWLFHPIICWLSFYASATTIMRYHFVDKGFADFSRQK